MYLVICKKTHTEKYIHPRPMFVFYRKIPKNNILQRISMVTGPPCTVITVKKQLIVGAAFTLAKKTCLWNSNTVAPYHFDVIIIYRVSNILFLIYSVLCRPRTFNYNPCYSLLYVSLNYLLSTMIVCAVN